MSNLNRLALALSLAALPLAAQGKRPTPHESAPVEAPKKTSVMVAVLVKDEKGNPLENVIISVDDQEAMILTRGETDGGGNARLAIIHSGEAYVRATKPGLRPEQKKITVTPTDKPIEIVFVMKKTMP
jgi:hypothetical protein